jgi:hypothetical protein
MRRSELRRPSGAISNLPFGHGAGLASLTRADSSVRVAKPELHFRAMAPSEPLLELAREQDTLLREVLEVDAAASRVTIEKHGAGAFGVFVRATMRGNDRCGRAEHADGATAVRAAYTALLRHALQEIPCPCSAAA